MNRLNHWGFFLAGVIGFSGACCDALAVTATQEAVDIELTFNNSGETVVVNTVKFHVSDGPMTALIIENMALNPTRFGKMRYDLEDKESFSEVILTEVGNKKFDLEAVPKIPNGPAYLRFSYYGNMLTDGFIGKTVSDSGEMIYFDWAPMQWESALKYRKVVINLPHQVDKAECGKENLFKTYLGYLPSDGMNVQAANAVIKTEKSLNQRNKIDIACVDAGNDKYFLQLSIVQENVSSRESQRIQFYLPGDFIDFSGADIQTKKLPAAIDVSRVETQYLLQADGIADIKHQVHFNISNGPYTDGLQMIADDPLDKYEIKNLSLLDEKSGKPIEVSLNEHQINDDHRVVWPLNLAELPSGAYLLSYDYEWNSYRLGIIGNADEHDDEYFFEWTDDTALAGEDSRIRVLMLPIEMPDAVVSDAQYKEWMGVERGVELAQLNGANGKIRFADIPNSLRQIDLSTREVDGKHCLTLSVMSGTNDHLKLYIKKEVLPDPGDIRLRAEDDDSFNPDATELPLGVSLFLLVAAAGSGAFALTRRRKIDEKNVQKANSLNFKTYGDELWEAPELEIGAFVKEGKIVKNLHPIEVGLICGLSLQDIVGIMVQALGDQNKLLVRSLEPVNAVAVPDACLTPMEERFVQIFDVSGVVDENKLLEFLEKVIAELQEKTWDCDLNATREYYVSGLYRNPSVVKTKQELQFKLIEDKYYTDPDVSRPSDFNEDFWADRYYWRHYHGYYANKRHYNMGLPQNLDMGYQAFMKSSVCFHGCFEQPNLENACHSACHNACHSACHDACHSACHDACHSACHSACVSGSSR